MKLISTDRQIQQAILKHFADILTKAANKAKNNIIDRTKTLVEDSIRKSPEYQSLLGGKLRGSLGVVDAQPALDNALDVWLRQIFIVVKTFKPSADGFTGGFSLNIIETKKQEVIELSNSSYVTEKGETIPWMQWLLEAGQSTIIRDYIAITGDLSHIKHSRTGEGIMRFIPNRVYKVPLEFSGDKDDNFVTRSLYRSAFDIATIMQDEFEYEFYRA